MRHEPLLFFTACYVFSSWYLTPGRSLINPIAFNEQLINIHIPWQIFHDILLTSAYVIGLSSSLAIKYWWVCKTQPIAVVKSVTALLWHFALLWQADKYAALPYRRLLWCQLPTPHRQRRKYVQNQQRGEREFFKCFWSE